MADGEEEALRLLEEAARVLPPQVLEDLRADHAVEVLVGKRPHEGCHVPLVGGHAAAHARGDLGEVRCIAGED